uniref:SS18 subunit of BAF chromatin remodeling complex n=1 Tax=Ovis aries TaxID=9940 RepID=A0AC11DY63_SHEEP
MSVAFAAPRQRGKGEITPAAIQKMLDENNHLIQCIMDYQNKGKTSECSHSVAQSCPTLCDPMNHSMPGLPVHHQLLEFTQTHVR